METGYLDTFVLVAESGSMSEAARRLEITPAAVAHQLRLLEREMGTRLLARAGRTVVPTEAGHRLAHRANAVLRELRNIKAAINEDAAAGELRLGAINTALHSLMPEVLAGFVKVYPDARVEIRSALSTELYDAVLRGELDAAICLHPPFVLPKSVSWEQLAEEPLVVMAPARWGQRDAHALLREEPLIRYNRNLGGGKQADAYCARPGSSRASASSSARCRRSRCWSTVAWASHWHPTPRCPGGAASGLPSCRWPISRIGDASESSGHAHRCARGSSRRWLSRRERPSNDQPRLRLCYGADCPLRALRANVAAWPTV